MVERFPAALADPLIEIGLYGRERRELPPLAVRRDDIKDRLRDAVQVNPTRSPRSLSPGQQRSNQRPFRIEQVTLHTQGRPGDTACG